MCRRPKHWCWSIIRSGRQKNKNGELKQVLSIRRSLTVTSTEITQTLETSKNRVECPETLNFLSSSVRHI